MKGRRTMKRMLSMLLVLVMVLGFMPGGLFSAPEVQAAGADQDEKESYTIDFKEFAKEASKQDWWERLPAGKDANTKLVGCEGSNDPMTADELAAYAEMQEYLTENEIWNIDNGVSGLTNQYWNKRLYFNNSDAVEWGMLFFPIYHANMPERAKLGLTIEIPEGAAGIYRFDAEVFLEDTASTSAVQTGLPAAGGHANIYVNDELIVEEYAFKPNATHKNKLYEECFGSVYLTEGTNTIVLYSTGDTNKTTAGGRANYGFGSISFTMVEKVNSLKMDFKAFAKNAAEQSWWDGLRAAPNANTKFIGSISSAAAGDMTADQKAAYDQMLAYMAQNEIWSIDEAKSNFKGYTYFKRLFFSADPTVPWGLCFYPYYHNTGSRPERSKLAFTLNVPAGGAGYYAMDLSVFKETTSFNSTAITGTSSGGALIDVFVNDVLVYDDYSTIGSNVIATNGLGAVYLDEGENSIVVESSYSYNNTGAGGRCNIDLNYIEFFALDAEEVEMGQTTMLDLRTSYLAFDAVVDSTYAVASSEEEIVTASFNADGNLIIKGLAEGEAELTVTQADETVCTVAVLVTPKSSLTYDFSKAADKTAEGFNAIASYDDLAADDGIVTDDWYFDSVAGKAYYSKANSAAVLAGTEICFVVNVPESRWYAPSLGAYTQPLGGNTTVYLDELYLGTVNTLADNKTFKTMDLRPVYLEAGEYVLTLTNDGTELWWSNFRLKNAEEPELTLEAEGAISTKQGRTASVALSAMWNDILPDDMTDADWSLDCSAEGVTPWIEDNMLCVTGDEPGEYEVDVTVEISGIEATVTVPVTVIAPAKLESMELEIFGVEKIVARNTIQQLDYTFMGDDGEEIYPNEVNITYTAEPEGMVEFDTENHTFRTLQNGDVTIDIEAEKAGVVFTKTVKLTIEDRGENRYSGQSSDFEEVEPWNKDNWHWDYGTTYAKPADTSKHFVYGEVIEEESGNHALKLTFNPNVSYTNVKTGSELRTDGGNFVHLKPGHLYEFTFRARVEDLQVPTGSTATFQLLYQNYDYPVNQFQSTVVNDFYTSCSIVQTTEEWVEYTVPVRAPITNNGDIYVMHRLVFRPSSSAFYDLTGWSGTVYLDDFEVREVGFDHVKTYLESPLTDTENPSNLMVEAYTTTGSLLVMDADSLAETVKVTTTNEDVIDIKGDMTTKKNVDGVAIPAIPVGLVGLNAEAALNVDVTIHGLTQSTSLDATQTNMADVIRDMDYRLDDFEAYTMKRGDVAEGVITARTTQLAGMTEEFIRENGSVYFTSSDTTIATVDQATGDVTAVGEGKVIISAYVLIDGITRSDKVELSVTDDTDLAAIDVTMANDYLTVGRGVQLNVSGTKASGGRADMDNFPVAFSVEQSVIDEGIVTLTKSGFLTANKVGNVTVTVTAGVEGREVSDTITIAIISDQELPNEGFAYEFTYGKVVNLETATLEEDRIEIDTEKTTAVVSYHAKHGISSSMTAGQELVLKIQAPKSGWYTVENWGAAFSYGCETENYVDDAYVGYMSHIGTSSYDQNSIMNTIWLDAGVHTVRIVCAKKGTLALGRLVFTATDDPNEMVVSVDAKPELLTGESTELAINIETANDYGTYTLKTVTEAPEYTNYCIITSSDPHIVSVSGRTLTAQKPGTATITVTCEIAGEEVVKTIDLAVMDGVIGSVKAEAENHTLLPDAEGTVINVTAYTPDGIAMEAMPEDVTITFESLNTEVASVDAQGNVTITGVEGSAEIVVNVNENGRDMTVSAWVTVTTGKTQPTLYTYAERENARENALKYDWAWQMREAAVSEADYIVENIDIFYDLYVPFFTEARAGVGTRTDPDRHTCRYCHINLADYPGATYAWIVDPINNPWKIQCPGCKRNFPSNDFGAYYESGLDENGVFSYDLADDSLLTNDLYPEMGEGWGVDDGQGYTTDYLYPNGAKLLHNYIQYYVHALFYQLGNSRYSYISVITALRDAYLYTGDEKYGNAGAILIDRMADIYPDYKYLYDWDTGWVIGCIWEANNLQPAICTGADAFWPCQSNDEVIDYLKERAPEQGKNPDDITPEYLRNKVEENLMLIIKRTCETKQSSGNFGMHQSAMAYAAVCLDRLPESAEMIDWIFRSSATVMEPNGKYEILVTGGDLMDRIVQRVDRDGFGDEGSDAYNRMWYQNLLECANALQGYDRVEGANLWENPKFVTMFDCYVDMLSMGTGSFQTGENGSIQMYQLYLETSALLKAFVETGDREIAQALYYANGNTTDGLHADIFTKDPESGIKGQIQLIIDEDGELNWNESEILGGRGIAMLRNGPAKLVKGENEAEFSDYAMLFVPSDAGHGARETLSVQINAYGLILTPTPGYPNNVNEQDPQREQWVRNTVSHNTVVVNDKAQDVMSEPSFPLHFDDAGFVKIMDASAPGVYTEADIYRRTMVTVDKGDGAYYGVDFFRVLGGSEHVYSFHGATMLQPETTGLEFIHQPMGTYESPDLELGKFNKNPYSTDAAANRGSGYNWLYDVYRDADPETTYSVDFLCQDFRNTLVDASGIHLKLTMHSEEPLTEVAIANGYSIQKQGNPEYLKYLLARRSGENGMDTLFTSVIEPYRYNSSIASSELVDVVLVEGTESKLDKAVAMKVVLTTGRVDYVIYATNPNCLYSIVDNGEEVFKFQGFTGVASYEGGQLTYAYGNEATTLEDAEKGAVIENAQAAITGELLDFTEGLSLEGYTMTISMDQPVDADELVGRYIYVNNDGTENAVYRIWGAEVSGNNAVLDLKMQTMTRRYIDPTDLSAGFIHNVAVGQTYSIPLSASFDIASLFTYTKDQVIKAGGKLNVTTGVAGSGVTYEADGLVSGMRLDAKTGQLTWTTSKTNTGRFPVTIKAVRNGEVVGEVSFVVYVVGYTGSTYSPDICSHSKAETFEADGMIETVCPSCGTITKEEKQAEKINIAGANMSLGNELKLNVMVRSADLGDGIYTAKITHGDTVTEEQFTELNSTYHYVSATVSAKQMADVITVEVMDENGNVVSDPYETSVRDYAMKALANAGTKAEMKTLAVDMLNYGSEAQIYFKYNAEDLANSLLTEDQKALATGTVPCENRQVKGTNFYGSNLSLEDKIVLNLFFRNCTADMYAEVSFTDYKGREKTVTKSLLQHSDILYRVAVDEIVLSDAFSDVSVTVYNADGTVHGTATDAVESYCARAGENALNTAIMKFAYSAKQYLG